MLSRKEIQRIIEMRKKGKSKAGIARKSGHTRSTVRKYLKDPVNKAVKHTWRTRANPFEAKQSEIEELLNSNPGLEATTIFEYLNEKYPKSFKKGQLRTLQRHIKRYRGIKGEAKEVMFEQIHRPGELCSSDFTDMSRLGITTNKEPFPHLLYHFTLTYSNWEWARVCRSESFESLQRGLKGALKKLGGVPRTHLTDRLSAAVHNLKNPGEFKARYEELLTQLKLKGRATQPRSPNENGDIEQRNYRLKRAIEQQLMLRGSKEFASQKDYEEFINSIIDKLNERRKKGVSPSSPCEAHRL